VDPMFGTLDDFDALVSRAHELGLKVIIDQVYSHTSDQHAWFEESRQSRDNDKADWYIWADAKPDGSPPNNWQSVFACPAWTWDARRQQYYMHNFLPEQPDLNLHSVAVQDALLEVGKFWLERGVDGFRLDAINCGMHDPLLRDNPAAEAPFRNETRPCFMQMPKYNMCHDDMPQVLERVRSVINGFGDIVTVAEVGTAEPLPVMKDYTKGGSRLHTAYGFEFLGTPELTAERVTEVLSGWPGESPDEGWPSWAFSNHDAPRVASRWGLDVPLEQRVRLISLLQFCLRGNVFVYQGEELGLTQAHVPYEKIQDPEALTNWPHTLGRDGARTPMPWIADAVNAGFSSHETWLPVADEHAAQAIDVQAADSASILAHFKALIAMRKASPALRYGELEFIEAPEGVLAFSRVADGERALCVFNLGGDTVTWSPPDLGDYEVVAQVGTQPASLGRFEGYIGLHRDG
ncbi:MAG: alpha-amylase family glycosyl hydrolase, partial [Pseudomonadota bacterium]